MRFPKFLKLKRKKNEYNYEIDDSFEELNIDDIEIDKEEDKKFEFKYNTICPAISMITLKNDNSTYLWISTLFELFNKVMLSDKFVISNYDLDKGNRHNWFQRVFDCQIWEYSDAASKSPKIWGKYYWGLLHLISLFWTTENHMSIVYLLLNLHYILPCEQCKKHYLAFLENK